MPRNRLHLTEQMVRSLTTEQPFEEYLDTEVAGFGVRVRPSGRKAFFISYRSPEPADLPARERRMRRMTLGTFPDLPLEEARSRARDALGQVERGIDPLLDEDAGGLSTREPEPDPFWSYFGSTGRGRKASGKGAEGAHGSSTLDTLEELLGGLARKSRLPDREREPEPKGPTWSRRIGVFLSAAGDRCRIFYADGTYLEIAGDAGDWSAGEPAPEETAGLGEVRWDELPECMRTLEQEILRAVGEAAARRRSSEE